MQVIDSKNNVLGDKKIIDFGADTLTYSFMTTVKYEKKQFKLQKIYLVRILKRNLFCKCFDKIKWFLVLFWNKRRLDKKRGA
jgi:hypothetical protein